MRTYNKLEVVLNLPLRAAQVDVFAHDLLLLPVHLGVHWCLCVADFRARRLRYLDSMGGRNRACLDALRQYLRDEHRDKKGLPFDDRGWKSEILKVRCIHEARHGYTMRVF